MQCKHPANRVLYVYGKVNDCCVLQLGSQEHEGYIPDGIEEIGNGDELKFEVCLDCGKLMGDFPISEEITDKIFNRED